MKNRFLLLCDDQKPRSNNSDNRLLLGGDERDNNNDKFEQYCKLQHVYEWWRKLGHPTKRDMIKKYANSNSDNSINHITLKGVL